MKKDKLSSVEKLMMKACAAVNAINEVERTLRDRVGLKTTLTLDKELTLKIARNIQKAKKSMHEVRGCISEGAKANRRRDV